MRTYSLKHLSDSTLLHDLAALVARDRATTAALLAHLGEVDARKLYLPAAYPSTYAYCVGELRMSEETACRRIRAARAARDFPAIFAAVADGRLHLSAVVLLAPQLTAENAPELLAAAAFKSKSEIERLLADRFPRPDVPTRIQAIPSTAGQPMELPSPVTVNLEPLAPGPGPAVAAPARPDLSSAAGPSAPARMDAPQPRPRVAPLAPERFALQVTIGQRAKDNLNYARELGSTSDVAEILDQALELYVRHLEKRKFAATTRPRRVEQRANANGRYVSAEVRRAVWKRDSGRCTFVSDAGRRCAERSGLEFDHVTAFGRGGQATIAGMRLRCRAHNQYGAECTYGAAFMQRKREDARRMAEERRGATPSAAAG